MRFRLISILTLLVICPPVVAEWHQMRGDAERTNRSDASFDPLQLQKRWSLPLGYKSPVISGDTLLAIYDPQSGGEERKVSAFDLHSGQHLWTDIGLHGIVAPAVVAGKAYYSIPRASGQEWVIRDARTGSVEFQQIRTFPGWGTDLAFAPASGGEMKFYTARGGVGQGYTFDGSSIQLDWTSSVFSSGASAPALLPDSIAYSSSTGIHLSRRSDGASQTLYSTGVSSGGTGGVTAFDAANHRLFATDIHGWLRTYDYDGFGQLTELWTRPSSGSSENYIAPFAIAADGTVYSRNGVTTDVDQLDPVTGAVLRTLALPDFAGLNLRIQGNHLWAGTHEQSWATTPATLRVYGLDNLQLVREFHPENWAYTVFEAEAFSGDAMVLSVDVTVGDYYRLDVYVVPEPSAFASIGLLAFVARRR